jgi:hypothetical protein
MGMMRGLLGWGCLLCLNERLLYELMVASGDAASETIVVAPILIPNRTVVLTITVLGLGHGVGPEAIVT